MGVFIFLWITVRNQTLIEYLLCTIAVMMSLHFL